jgi:copper-binding protein NosD
VISVIVGVVLRTVAGSIVRNNQMTSPSPTGTGIFISGGGGNLVSGNVISGFGIGVFAEGNNYFLENMVSNCNFGFTLSASDKYRFNTTFACTTPFTGGTALTDENN